MPPRYAKIDIMDRERVLTILREHEPELNATGITHLRLFGSVARGDQTQASDIDLLADFDAQTRMTLLSLCHLQNRLSDILEAEVDLIPSRACVTSRAKMLPARRFLPSKLFAF